jgi:hypothetical protein
MNKTINNMRLQTMFKRAIILTESNRLIMRHDINVNQDNLEKDLFHFIITLEKEKDVLNSKKLMNMLKAYHGITLSDSIDFISNNKNWRINDYRDVSETLTLEEYCDIEV